MRLPLLLLSRVPLLESWPANLKSLRIRSKMLQKVISESTLTALVWQEEGTIPIEGRSSRLPGASLGHLFLEGLLKANPYGSEMDEGARWFYGPQDLGKLSDHFLGWQRTRLEKLEVRFGTQAYHRLSTYRIPKRSTLYKRKAPKFFF